MIKKPSILILLLTTCYLFPLHSTPLSEPYSIPEVNTAGPEFPASFTADGTVMVFSSKRSSSYYDIFMSHYREGSWSKPELLDVLNSPYNDETPYITPDGKTILFSSDRDDSIALPRDSMGRVRVSYDIYRSDYVNSSWSRPVRLPNTVNTGDHERFPSLSVDKKTLYFSRWPFGDISQSRIYLSSVTDSGYSNPTELPALINAGFQEMAFYPSTDGRRYYFSSRRANGPGGFDLYTVEPSPGGFTEPRLLTGPVNSPGDDFSFFETPTGNYVCSNRAGKSRNFDIYSLSTQLLHFLIRNKKDNTPLASVIRVKFLAPAGKTGALLQGRSGTDGKCALPAGLKSPDRLQVIVEREGYLPFIKSFSTKKLLMKETIIDLIPGEIDSSFETRDIYFDSERASLKKESLPFLDAFSDYLKKNESLRLKIIGHTDLHGTLEYNDRLSLERAAVVKDYLVKKGINPGRLTLEGAGMRKPKMKGTGRKIDYLNRRTEFIIVR